jgi:hypothetical protein
MHTIMKPHQHDGSLEAYGGCLCNGYARSGNICGLEVVQQVLWQALPYQQHDSTCITIEHWQTQLETIALARTPIKVALVYC